MHLAGIVCVSAKSGDISELTELLGRIQSEKSRIMTLVNEERCKALAKVLVQRVDTLINAADNKDGIEEEMRAQKLKINKLQREIENSSAEISSKIDEIGRAQSRKFEDEIFARLESIVSGKSNDYDSEALTAINNTATVFLNEYKAMVHKLMSTYASKYEGVSGVDLNSHAISGIGYNINLNEAGHEYDNTIGNIVKGVAVVGAVVATAGVAAGATGAAAAGEAAAGAAAAGKAGAAASVARGALVAADVADTVTDVASIMSNRKMQKQLDTVVRYGKAFSDNIDKVNEFDTKTGSRLGQKKGFVASMVGFVTERTMGRPQRRRAITQYIDSTLAPQFKSELTRIGTTVSANVANAILESTKEAADSLTATLQQMTQQCQTRQEEYRQRINDLKSIKKELIQYE